MLSGSIQVYRVLGIGISLTEWASRGISTRGKMNKAGRVRPQSGITKARQLGIPVLAPISVLLHDSDTGFPSSKSRSNQKYPMTYGALHMKLQQHLLCLEKEKHGEGPSHASAEETQFKTKKTAHHEGSEQTCGIGETRPDAVSTF